MTNNLIDMIFDENFYLGRMRLEIHTIRVTTFSVSKQQLRQPNHICFLRVDLRAYHLESCPLNQEYLLLLTLSLLIN